jgi:hypothetical protein
LVPFKSLLATSQIVNIRRRIRVISPGNVATARLSRWSGQMRGRSRTTSMTNSAGRSKRLLPTPVGQPSDALGVQRRRRHGDEGHRPADGGVADRVTAYTYDKLHRVVLVAMSHELTTDAGISSDPSGRRFNTVCGWDTDICGRICGDAAVGLTGKFCLRSASLSRHRLLRAAASPLASDIGQPDKGHHH